MLHSSTCRFLCNGLLFSCNALGSITVAHNVTLEDGLVPCASSCVAAIEIVEMIVFEGFVMISVKSLPIVFVFRYR